MFERCVLSQQAHLDIGRRYLQAFGFSRGVGAIVADMDQGLIPLEKAQLVLSHMHLLFIEYVARRVGFTRFNAVSKDPEFVTLQTDSLTGVLQRHGPHAKERSARAIEG